MNREEPQEEVSSVKDSVTSRRGQEKTLPKGQLGCGTNNLLKLARN